MSIRYLCEEVKKTVRCSGLQFTGEVQGKDRNVGTMSIFMVGRLESIIGEEEKRSKDTVPGCYPFNIQEEKEEEKPGNKTDKQQSGKVEKMFQRE